MATGNSSTKTRTRARLSKELLALVEKRLSAKEVQALIAAGASVNTRAGGRTPLHLVVSQGSVTTATMLLLLAAGADVNAKDRSWDTPLHMVARHTHPRFLLKSVRFLVENGADTNAQNKTKQTPLHILAARHMKDDFLREVITVLIENGANPNAKDNRGKKAGFSTTVTPAERLEDLSTLNGRINEWLDASTAVSPEKRAQAAFAMFANVYTRIEHAADASIASKKLSNEERSFLVGRLPPEVLAFYERFAPIHSIRVNSVDLHSVAGIRVAFTNTRSPITQAGFLTLATDVGGNNWFLAKADDGYIVCIADHEELGEETLRDELLDVSSVVYNSFSEFLVRFADGSLPDY